VRAERNLLLGAQDQMKILDPHHETHYDPVNQNRRIPAHCHALPFGRIPPNDVPDDYRAGTMARLDAPAQRSIAAVTRSRGSRRGCSVTH
jgi:hypothetical protein